MLIKRCSYKKSADKGRAERFAVPEQFLPVLDVAGVWFDLVANARAADGKSYSMSRETLAGEFFQIAAVDWFENITGMRVGDYLARVERGERFEFKRVGNGWRFESVSTSVTIQ